MIPAVYLLDWIKTVFFAAIIGIILNLISGEGMTDLEMLGMGMLIYIPATLLLIDIYYVKSY